MVSADETPVRGAGLNNGNAEPPGKKPAKRSRKPAKKAEAKPEQPVELQDEISAAVAASSATETSVVETPAVAPTDTSPVAAADFTAAEILPVDPVPAATPTAPAPVNLQTIGNAFGNYTLKSLEQTSSFFEQLAGAQSLSKALELQSAYARQTFETFVAESEKIRGLHREMTRQRWNSLEGLMAGTKAARAK
jgi:hypothetical protein